MAQYRSLLINTARLLKPDGDTPIRDAGAGVLNLAAAVSGTVTATPTSFKFGTGNGTIDVSRELTIANLGTAADTFTITAVSQDGKAVPAAPAPLSIEAGKSAAATVKFAGAGLTAGEYQGYFRVQGTKGQPELHIPYWYGVPGAEASITVLEFQASGKAGGSSVFGVRVVDAAGIALNIKPSVTAVQGGKVLEIAEDAEKPGAYGVAVQLAPGENTFKVAAGSATRTLTIQAE